MMRHCGIKQMSAFNFAWSIIKALPGDPRIEQMRNYVLSNSNSPSPQVRESAENVYRYITSINSGEDPGPRPKMFDMHEIMRLNAEGGLPRGAMASQQAVDTRGMPMMPPRTDDLSGLPMATQEALRAAQAKRARPARMSRMPSEAEERAMADVDMMREVSKGLSPMQRAMRHIINKHFL
tara:strand:+ start:924 stop:1463 length:540 start_codon:yes stop_codon:yes gene_type:complete